MATTTGGTLGTSLDQLAAALSSGDQAKAQEAIREYNLTYANNVAQLYGQNFGPGQPAPIGAATLPAGQATGSIGYIPGYTGVDAGQTQSLLSTQAGTAQGAAGLTGYYAAPAQSAWTPGTFLRVDPNTFDYGKYGEQLDYVLSSGQLQRITPDQAKAMGWNGNMGQMAMVPIQTALRLESAPPSTPPQQTLQGLTTYSNLNTNAQNTAIAQSGVTGMYQAPQLITPPGTNAAGGKFSDIPADQQQAYYQAHGGDWQSAMAAWVGDSNNAIRQAVESAGGTWNPNAPGGNAANLQGPQETLAAQNQYFTQGMDLSNAYGQYYTPGMPGQAGQAGVNTPQQGQLTLANINQQNAIKNMWAQAYGYVPQFDANGQPIFQAGPNGNPATTLAAQQQTYAQQMGIIKQAADLQANPFRQQQAIGQMGRLLGGQTVAGFAAPQTVAGVGTAGGNTQGGMGYLQQMIDDIQGGGAANSQSVNSVLDAIPTPTKLDSVQFFKSPTSTQNMVLQGMQEKYGLDPTDSLTQIKNTLPGFQSPTTYGTVKRAGV